MSYGPRYYTGTFILVARVKSDYAIGCIVGVALLALHPC